MVCVLEVKICRLDGDSDEILCLTNEFVSVFFRAASVVASS